jgi:hypothetical protein
VKHVGPGQALELLEQLMQVETLLKATPVNELRSLDEFTRENPPKHQVPVAAGACAIRAAEPVTIQQPTIAQVWSAPTPSVAAQQGVSDGGLIRVSGTASIIPPPILNFHVLRTASPPGAAPDSSQTLSVVVPEAEKFNPSSYSQFTVQEPDGSVFEVPVRATRL